MEAVMGTEPSIRRENSKDSGASRVPTKNCLSQLPEFVDIGRIQRWSIPLLGHLVDRRFLASCPGRSRVRGLDLLPISGDMKDRELCLGLKRFSFGSTPFFSNFSPTEAFFLPLYCFFLTHNLRDSNFFLFSLRLISTFATFITLPLLSNGCRYLSQREVNNCTCTYR